MREFFFSLKLEIKSYGWYFLARFRPFWFFKCSRIPKRVKSCQRTTFNLSFYTLWYMLIIISVKKLNLLNGFVTKSLGTLHISRYPRLNGPNRVNTKNSDKRALSVKTQCRDKNFLSSQNQLWLFNRNVNWSEFLFRNMSNTGKLLYELIFFLGLKKFWLENFYVWIRFGSENFFEFFFLVTKFLG